MEKTGNLQFLDGDIAIAALAKFLGVRNWFLIGKLRYFCIEDIDPVLESSLLVSRFL